VANAKIFIRNLTANWVGHGVNLVVMFFLSPFVVHTLGTTQYGIWQILTVLTGYMGVLDLGVRASTGRFIVLYLGKKEYGKIDQTIRTGLGLYTCVGGLILIVSCILGLEFPRFFPSVSSEYRTLVRLLLPVLAVNIWISAFRTVLSSILTAHDRFDLARGSDLIMLAFRTIGTIIMLKLGQGLIGLTIAVIGCNIVGLLVNFLMARKVHRELRLWPLILKKERIKELYNYGIGAFVITVSAKIIGQTDLIIVGNLISIDAVTVYSVGAMLLYYSNTFLQQISTTLFPQMQRAVARGEMRNAKWLFFRQNRLAMFFGILMFVGYISFGNAFIELWMYHPDTFPHESVNQAALLMGILAASKLLILFSYGTGSILSAMGHIGFTAKVTISQAFMNLALSIIFVVFFHWGLAGVAAGTFAGRILTSTIVVPWYACKKMKINFGHYVMVIGGNIIGIGGVFALICLGVQKLMTAETWPEFLLQVGIATACYLPIAYFVIFSNEDKKRISEKISEVLHNRRV
jgi:O-antigen/teichoic acid export membrane protein